MVSKIHDRISQYKNDIRFVADINNCVEKRYYFDEFILTVNVKERIICDAIV